MATGHLDIEVNLHTRVAVVGVVYYIGEFIRNNIIWFVNGVVYFNFAGEFINKLALEQVTLVNYILGTMDQWDMLWIIDKVAIISTLILVLGYVS